MYIKTLKTSPYGRCVYHCDNDVVDHMSITLEFDQEITAVFSLSAFTNEISRTIKIMGTQGEIQGHMEEEKIKIKKFGAKSFKTISLKTENIGGHGGGDWNLIKDFCTTLKQGTLETKTSISTSLESHIMAFALNEACTSKHQVNLQEFYNRHVN